MQLIYLTDIFQDNYKIVRDRFETDPVNVMKNRPLFCKETKEIPIYISFSFYILGDRTNRIRKLYLTLPTS